jgi:hypothetical protein
LRRRRPRPLKAKQHEQTAFLTALHPLPQEKTAEQERLFVAEAPVRRPPTVTAQRGVADDILEVPTREAYTTGHVYGAVAPLTGRTHSRLGSTLGQGEFTAVLRPLRTSYRDKR